MPCPGVCASLQTALSHHGREAYLMQVLTAKRASALLTRLRLSSLSSSSVPTSDICMCLTGQNCDWHNHVTKTTTKPTTKRTTPPKR